MPGALVSYTAAEAVTLALVIVLAILGALLGYRAWKSSRITAEEREQRRRNALVSHGKMGDATLVELRDDLVFYSYLVRGVEYTASQSTLGLQEFMPRDLSVVGAVFVKYDPRNPANSIVLAETWSGLHATKVS